MVKVVVLFSGKRKSGKDYVSSRLKKALDREFITESNSVSHSLKAEYAALKGLEVKDLLSDGPYKEIYREEMIKWGEEKRNHDNEYFSRQTIPKNPEKVDILIITDCRRPSDIAFYKQNFENVLLVRVECNLEERARRGYVFIPAVDEAASECALDDFIHDFHIENSGDNSILQSAFISLVSTIAKLIKN